MPRTHFLSSPAFFRILKLGLPIAAVMVCAMSIWAMMALAKFNSTLAEVTDSRLSVILYDMRDTIEQGLQLGINLPELENIEDTIARAEQRDPEISAIYVLGRQDEILYRSPMEAPDLAEAAIKGFHKAVVKKSLASARNGGIIDAVTVLRNSFSQKVGTLVVKYDATSLDERFEKFKDSFLRQAIIFLLAGIVLVGIVTTVLLRRLEQATSEARESANTAGVATATPVAAPAAATAPRHVIEN